MKKLIQGVDLGKTFRNRQLSSLCSWHTKWKIGKNTNGQSEVCYSEKVVDNDFWNFKYKSKAKVNFMFLPCEGNNNSPKILQ